MMKVFTRGVYVTSINSCKTSSSNLIFFIDSFHANLLNRSRILCHLSLRLLYITLFFLYPYQTILMHKQCYYRLGSSNFHRPCFLIMPCPPLLTEFVGSSSWSILSTHKNLWMTPIQHFFIDSYFTYCKACSNTQSMFVVFSFSS